MVVFLFRPSPQVPRPSSRAAVLAFEASQYNIHRQREQIRVGNIDLTWIFTQQIFMAINTILWALSYSRVRELHSREAVENNLKTALDAAEYASERWPGVNSAKELYENLIVACMRIYEKDGDVPIAAMSPVSTSSIPAQSNSSQATSPATNSTKSVATPPDGSSLSHKASRPAAPPARHSEPSPQHTFLTPNSKPQTSAYTPVLGPSSAPEVSRSRDNPTQNLHFDGMLGVSYDPNSQYNKLPTTFSNLAEWDQLPNVLPNNSAGVDATGMVNGNQSMATSVGSFGLEGDWQPGPMRTASYSEAQLHPQSSYFNVDMADAQYANYLSQPYWSMDGPVTGLNHMQQYELMQCLKTDGLEQVEDMVRAGNQFLANLETPTGTK